MTATWPICFWGPSCAEFAESRGVPLYKKAHAVDFGAPEVGSGFVVASVSVGSEEALSWAGLVAAAVSAEPAVASEWVVASLTVVVTCGSIGSSEVGSEPWPSVVPGASVGGKGLGTGLSRAFCALLHSLNHEPPDAAVTVVLVIVAVAVLAFTVVVGCSGGVSTDASFVSLSWVCGRVAVLPRSFAAMSGSSEGVGPGNAVWRAVSTLSWPSGRDHQLRQAHVAAGGPRGAGAGSGGNGGSSMRTSSGLGGGSIMPPVDTLT